MRSNIDIDRVHSRAIIREIGERLHSYLRPEPKLPARLKSRIARLRELEQHSPSIVPDVDHRKNTSPSISGPTRIRLTKRRGPNDFARSQSWRARPSDMRCLQKIPITTERPISTKKVSAMIATVRNTSPTGTGVMARLALRSPGAQSQTLRRGGMFQFQTS